MRALRALRLVIPRRRQAQASVRKCTQPSQAWLRVPASPESITTAPWLWIAALAAVPARPEWRLDMGGRADQGLGGGLTGDLAAGGSARFVAFAGAAQRSLESLRHFGEVRVGGRPDVRRAGRRRRRRLQSWHAALLGRFGNGRHARQLLRQFGQRV